MDIAVAGVHVQRGPHAAFEHAFVNGGAFSQQRGKCATGEDPLQRRADLGLPAGAQAVVLQLWEQHLDVGQPGRPQGAHVGHHAQGLGHAAFQQLGGQHVAAVTRLVGFAQRQVARAQKGRQLVAQLDFVGQAQLDVDALDAVGVFGHARQRNHHVFVDLEGVGVAADRSGFFAVQPEFLARFGADGDKAFAAARVGNPHDLAGGAGHGVRVVPGDVANQQHFGQATAFGLGGVTHGPQVAVVQVLQPRQQHR